VLGAPALREHYLTVRIRTPHCCEEAVSAAVPLLAVVQELSVVLADYGSSQCLPLPLGEESYIALVKRKRKKNLVIVRTSDLLYYLVVCSVV
jgi:hypothetical protein